MMVMCIYILVMKTLPLNMNTNIGFCLLCMFGMEKIQIEHNVLLRVPSIIILDQASSLKHIPLLISIVATQTVIDVNEPLRLISRYTEINPNDDFNIEDADAIIFEWSEENGHLTKTDLVELNSNNDDTNLVITGGNLVPGVYIFSINITIWLDGKIVGGGSGSKQIEVKPGPFITLFEAVPDCSNVTLVSLEDAFTKQYELNVKAE